jgi:hypothetical protein
MLETGKAIGRPEPSFEGIDLRDLTLPTGQNAYDRFQELAGQLPSGPSLKQTLAEVIRSQTYRDLPDGEASVKGTRLNTLGRVVSKYREAARKTLIAEHRAFFAPFIKAREREAYAAFRQNRSARQQGQPGAKELLGALRGGTN